MRATPWRRMTTYGPGVSSSRDGLGNMTFVVVAHGVEVHRSRVTLLDARGEDARRARRVDAFCRFLVEAQPHV